MPYLYLWKPIKFKIPSDDQIKENKYILICRKEMIICSISRDKLSDVHGSKGTCPPNSWSVVRRGQGVFLYITLHLIAKKNKKRGSAFISREVCLRSMRLKTLHFDINANPIVLFYWNAFLLRYYFKVIKKPQSDHVMKIHFRLFFL